MKKLIILGLSLICLLAKAQVVTQGTLTRTTAAGTTVTTVRQSTAIDSNTIVRDSAGVRYSYNDWHKLMTTGKYILKIKSRPTDSVKEFTVVKADAETLARMKMYRPAPDETGPVKTGETLELFKAKDINGYKIDPKNLQGKVVVLNFWFINCMPCRQEIPELNKIQADYASNPDVIFVGVATDQKDELKEFLRNNPFTYHIVDDGHDLAVKYGVKGFPTNVIIGKDGKVKLHSMGYGPFTLDDFRKTIDAELK